MYRYQDFRAETFTDEGQRTLIEVRDKARRLLAASGAVTLSKLIPTGDSWKGMAFVHRLVEIGDLRSVCVDGGGEEIFVAAGALRNG